MIVSTVRIKCIQAESTLINAAQSFQLVIFFQQVLRHGDFYLMHCQKNHIENKMHYRQFSVDEIIQIFSKEDQSCGNASEMA